MGEYRPPFSACTFFSQEMAQLLLWHPLFRRYFPVTAGRSAYWYASQDGPDGDFSGSGGSAENSEQRAIGKITIKRNMVKIIK
jgi:hypothetical protein